MAEWNELGTGKQTLNFFSAVGLYVWASAELIII